MKKFFQKLLNDFARRVYKPDVKTTYWGAPDWFEVATAAERRLLAHIKETERVRLENIHLRKQVKPETLSEIDKCRLKEDYRRENESLKVGISQLSDSVKRLQQENNRDAAEFRSNLALKNIDLDEAQREIRKLRESLKVATQATTKPKSRATSRRTSKEKQHA